MLNLPFVTVELMAAEPAGVDRPLTDALDRLELELLELTALLRRVSERGAVAAIIIFGFGAGFRAAAKGFSIALAGGCWTQHPVMLDNWQHNGAPA